MANIFSKKYLLYFTCLFVLLNACKTKPQQLTNEEAISFAKQMQISIKKGESDFLDNAFDKDAFIKKMNLPDEAVGKGFGSGIMEKLNLGTQISNTLSDQDQFEFIKHYVKENKHHVIFRLYGAKESTLNYHDYELLKVDDKCKIADVYIYMSGETLAETMRNMYNELFEKSKEMDRNTVSGMGDLKDIKQLVQRGKHAQAKKMYDALPAYLKESKAILLFNVLICSGLSNEEYSESIDMFNKKFPNEPNMNLLMIDGYFLQKDYVKMLAAVNALDAQIDKDPLMDFYRYLSYNLLQDEEKGRVCLYRLLKNMPDFQRGYMELIAVELDAKNKPVADSLISVYRKKPKFDQEALDTMLLYY